MIKLQQLTTEEAYKVNGILRNLMYLGLNRLLIATPTGEALTTMGIIIPGNSEEKPKKGVVVLRGEFDEDHRYIDSITKEGVIVTYGLYAGKEVELDPDIFPEDLRKKVLEFKFTVLDSNEVVLSEINK